MTPAGWFRNIVALLEKRPFAVLNVLLFSLFVGSFRLFAEWALGGFYPMQMAASLLTVSGFYWLSFFVITAVLGLTVPQPWRVSINVILVGVFLGVFPPLIDAAVSGTGFQYGFLWNVAGDWRWAIYNPDKNVPAGEAVVLWAVVALTGAYVRLKTKSALRTAAALALAYLAVIVIAGVPATLAERVREAAGWPLDHRAVLQVLLQYGFALAIYLALQPALAWGLARRAASGAAYAAAFIAGALAAGGLSTTVAAYGAVLLLGLPAVYAHAPSSAADDEDRRFLAVTAVLAAAALAAAGSTVAIAFVFMLLPLAARHGVPQWAGAGASLAGTALAGAVAALEHGAYEAPRWWISFVPRPLHAGVLGAYDGVLLAVLAAAFLAGAAANVGRRA